jgi:hypothetical protein
MLMKTQMRQCVDLGYPDIERKLSENSGNLKLREHVLSNPNHKIVFSVSWNKEKLSFNCSIAYLKKQENGKWKNAIRFDDAHGVRHMDSPEVKLKLMSDGFVLHKVRCPILIALINSLPKNKADTWKLKLFDEMTIGEQKSKEFLHKCSSDIKEGKSQKEKS